MFGAPSTPFGSSGGFGSASTPAFGSPAPAPFGAPAPAFGGFGTPAPAPSGFGGFGTPAPAPSGFGGFGTPAPAPGGFGAPAPGGFGAAPTPSLFGAPAPAPSGGLFGSAPAASGGLFGSAPAPSTGFGAPASSGFGGFGSSTPAPSFGGGSTFGAPSSSPSTGLFGAPAPAPSGGFGSVFGSTPSTFGAPAPPPSGGLFGAPAPAPTGGLFGSPAPSAAGGGTKMVPYQVTSRQDGTSSINLQAITAMPPYETKSFEELRFEDYSQGNRGTGSSATSGGFGGFGSPAPAPSGGLFGSSPAPTFGAPAPSSGGFGGFGAPAPAPFGAPAPSAFGAPSTGAFGAPAPAPFGAPAPSSGGLFGAPAPAPSGGLFGAPAPAPGGLFGSTSVSSGGLFGAPSPAPVFGAPSPSPGGLFGAPAPAPSGGLFGTPAPAPGGFGSSTFGAPAPSAFGGFGTPAPAPSGSLFGASSTFGAPAPSGGLFGAPAPAPSGGLFGAPAPSSGGFFGASSPAPAFGAMPAPPPAYGATYGVQPPPPMPAAPPVGAVIPPATNEILSAQLAALENKRKEMEKSDNFRSKPQQSSAVNAVTLSENDSLGALTPARVSYPVYRASPKSSARPRPRGFGSPEKATTPSLSRYGAGGKPMATPDSLAASSATRLLINPAPKPKLKLMLEPPSEGEDNSPLKITNGQQSPAANGHVSPFRNEKPNTSTPNMMNGASPQDNTLRTPKNGNGFDYYQQVIGSPDEAAGTGTPGSRATPSSSSCAPTLSKAGYKCSPPIEKLQAMPAEDLAAVSNFVIERPGVGKIEWEGAVDIRGADLDNQVVIEPKSASVYEIEEREDRKPMEGTKLNRPAVLTLLGVYPPSNSPEVEEKFARKVEKQTMKMGAELVDYNPSTGVWKLRVPHFSRYALDDDDSDSEAGNNVQGSPAKVSQLAIKPRRDTPFKPRSNVMFADEDGDEGETSIVSDTEMSESKAIEDAETAFQNLEMIIDNDGSPEDSPAEVLDPFPEEIGRSKPVRKSRFIPSAEDLFQAASMEGICASIAREAGAEKSSTDFGLRMGRSFRVGWGPDGSFFRPASGGGFVLCKPVFSENGNDDTLLGKHHDNSLKVGGKSNPQFTLPSGKANKQQLLTALSSYAQDDDKAESVDDKNDLARVARDAFSLLKCLSYGDKSLGAMVVSGYAPQGCTELDRLNAIKKWLVSACRDDVQKEINSAHSRGSRLAALLAAVSGGDIQKACDIAENMGYIQLSTLLASGPEGRKDILKEVMSWTDNGAPANIPDELIRIYFMIGGDLHMEEDIYRRMYSPFDWRRRLTMKVLYNPANEELSVSNLIQSYERDLQKGTTPYPHPQYLRNRSRDQIQCVLYRLLGLGNDGLALPLRDIIDPLGHTSSVHDFSLAFHLASAITAMDSTKSLSDLEEQTLLDGYIAQLLDQGKWEWATYVSLCMLDDSKTELSLWKSSRARSIILRNYTEEESRSAQKRQFLENIGVPSPWFEEALALRCSTNGDAYGYLNHMANVSTEATCAALEQILIPSTLFMSKDKVSEALKLLEVFSTNNDSLASAVSDLFQVHHNILMLEGRSHAEIEAATPALLSACTDVERIFSTYKSHEETTQGPALRMVPSNAAVPMSCFLAEGLSQISLFKLQLRALQEGISLSSTTSQILNLCLAKDKTISGLSSREDVCRWLM